MCAAPLICGGQAGRVNNPPLNKYLPVPAQGSLRILFAENKHISVEFFRQADLVQPQPRDPRASIAAQPFPHPRQPSRPGGGGSAGPGPPRTRRSSRKPAHEATHPRSGRAPRGTTAEAWTRRLLVLLAPAAAAAPAPAPRPRRAAPARRRTAMDGVPPSALAMPPRDFAPTDAHEDAQCTRETLQDFVQPVNEVRCRVDLPISCAATRARYRRDLGVRVSTSWVSVLPALLPWPAC
eukprot:SAG31_NODE_11982_length_980_cov_1.140749_1_plen_237_part_00